MTGRRAIAPASLGGYVEGWRMSPGLSAGGFLFLTGMTATDGGRVDPDPVAQVGPAFAKVDAVLAEAGLDWGAVVEMTSYHVGLRSHLAAVRAAWEARVRPPYPAWTAIEVAGFVTRGVALELRVVARHEDAAP